MLRALYTLLWFVALPFLPLRLLWRRRRERGDGEHIGERFGRYRVPIRAPVLWIHAVSLGETRAAAPLIERLRSAYPHRTLLLTHMTATGREAGRQMFCDRVVQAWLPYDLPFAVRAFLRHFRPGAGMLMETELWPNLVAEAAAMDIPIFLVNARLSQRSAAGYARVAVLTRPMLAALAGIAAQSAADARRLEALGAAKLVVTGNLKFDLDVPAEALQAGVALRKRLGEYRPVWLAASTREGEETLLLNALAAHPLPPEVLAVIVPRHPQRFDAVAEMLRQRGVSFIRRSELGDVPRDVAVVLGDSMGEMLVYCAAADVVFVGGSLVPLGGQNLIEPLAIPRPTLFGPHMFNFAEVAAKSLAAGATLQIADADALIGEVAALIADSARREQMRAAATDFLASHRGAGQRLWDWLAPQLAARVSSRDRG